MHLPVLLHPCRALLAASVFTILLGSTAFAQDPTDPTKLSADQLKVRVLGSLQALDGVAKKVDEAASKLEQEWDAKRKAMSTVHAELPSTPPPLEEQGTLDLAKAQALETAHRRYLEAYRGRVEAQKVARQSLAREAGLREGLRPEVERLDAQAKTLGPLMAELMARVAAKKITAESIEEGGKPVDLAAAEQRRAAAAKRAEELTKALASAPEIEKEIEALAQLKIHDPEVEARLIANADAAAQILVAVKQEASAFTEFEKRVPESLPGVLKRLKTRWDYEDQVFGGGVEEVNKGRKALADLVEEHKKLARPQPEEVARGGNEKLAEFARDLAFSKAMIAFHEAELTLFAKEAEAREALKKSLEAVESSLPGVVDLLTRLRACAQVVAAKKAAGELKLETIELDLDALWKKLVVHSEDGARRRTEIKALAELIEDTSAKRALEEALAKERTRHAELERLHAEEKSYAELVKKMSGEDSKALLALLAPGGEIAKLEAEISKELQTKKDELLALDAATVEARRGISSLENPLTLKASVRLYTKTETEDWRGELDSHVKELAEGAVLPDRSSRLLEKAPATNGDAQSSMEEQENGNLHKAAQNDQKRLKIRNIAANQVRQYFEELKKLTETYGKALEAQAAKTAELAEVYGRFVAIRKRRYACATEVNDRLFGGQLQFSEVPRYVVDQAERTKTLAAQKERDDFARDVGVLAERRKRDLERLKEVVAWRKWAEIRATNASRRMALIGNPVSFLESAMKSMKELPEVDQKNLQYVAATRDPSPGASALSLSFLVPFLSVTERELFEGPLEAYGLELADTRRKVEALEEALSGYNEMIQVANAEQAELEKGPEELRRAQRRREDDYHVARYLCSIARHPGAQTALELAFKNEFHRDLPLPEDDRDWALDFWKENLIAAEARLLGHVWWISSLERMVSRRGVEEETGGYRGQIGQIKSTIENEKVAEARLLASIEKLEIDFGTKARSHILWAFLELVFVIFGALFVQRLVKRLTRRINEQFEAEGEEDQSDRQKRMQTVTKAISNTFKIVIWIITFIYSLSLLGVNVTPLLASASVLGLAIAFGAQAMVRDFFSGLFILLENQYTIGDVVDVGGIAGTVERLSLRVTVLRDIEGVVHFIPNGTVSRVSNKTQNWSRCVMEVGVGYGEDVDHVRDVLTEIFVAMKKEPYWDRRLLETPMVAGVQGLMDSSVNLRVMAKTRAGKQWEVGREFNRRIKKRFDELGIEIPFPQRTVHHVYSDGSEVKEGEKKKDLPPPPPAPAKSPPPPKRDEDQEIIPE